MIKPGRHVEFKIDAATVYDMTAGGEFKINAVGTLPWATLGKRKIAGNAEFQSNTITLKVTPHAASEARQKYATEAISKRNLMAADCAQGSSKTVATRNALAVCATLAFVAGEMALKGNVDQ